MFFPLLAIAFNGPSRRNRTLVKPPHLHRSGYERVNDHRTSAVTRIVNILLCRSCWQEDSLDNDDSIQPNIPVQPQAGPTSSEWLRRSGVGTQGYQTIASAHSQVRFDEQTSPLSIHESTEEVASNLDSDQENQPLSRDLIPIGQDTDTRSLLSPSLSSRGGLDDDDQDRNEDADYADVMNIEVLNGQRFPLRERLGQCPNETLEYGAWKEVNLTGDVTKSVESSTGKEAEAVQESVTLENEAMASTPHERAISDSDFRERSYGLEEHLYVTLKPRTPNCEGSGDDECSDGLPTWAQIKATRSPCLSHKNTKWTGNNTLSRYLDSSPIYNAPNKSSDLYEDLLPNEFWHHSQDGEMRLHSIDPIPFNPLYERQVPQTPSICSLDSDFDCDSPLFKQSCRAMGRDKYLEGGNCMPKPLIAAGLVGISTGEPSLKPAQNRRRSLSVFRDEDPEPSALQPKPSVRRQLQDVTGHYYALANAQSIPQDENDKQDTTATSVVGYSGNEDELAELDSAVPVPLIDDHYIILLEGSSEVTIDLSKSLLKELSSPLTSPEPSIRESAEDLRDDAASSLIYSDSLPDQHLSLYDELQHAGYIDKSETPDILNQAGPSQIETGTQTDSGFDTSKTRSPTSILPHSMLRRMVLEDVKDWRLRHSGEGRGMTE